MGVISENVTPGQSRHFVIDIEGFNPFSAQQVSVPDVERDSVEMGTGETMVKFPGMTKTGDLVIKEIVNAFDADDDIFAWFYANGNPETGLSTAPYDKRDGTIQRIDGAGNVVQTWNVRGMWPKKIAGYSYDREKSEKIVREVTLSVDTCVPE
jgi:phage tail-like protein